MKANINDWARFRLTDDGYQVLVKKGIKVIPDVEGYIRMQLWVWAQTFGNEMYNGGPLLFVKNEIIIEES